MEVSYLGRAGGQEVLRSLVLGVPPGRQPASWVFISSEVIVGGEARGLCMLVRRQTCLALSTVCQTPSKTLDAPSCPHEYIRLSSVHILWYCIHVD